MMTATGVNDGHDTQHGKSDQTMTLDFSWVENLASAVFVFDADSMQVVAWNDDMEDLSGMAATRLISHSILSILNEESVERIKSAVAKVQEKSSADRGVKCSVLLPDTSVDLILSMSLYQDRHEKYRQIVCFAQEVEEPEQVTLPVTNENFPTSSIDSTGRIISWNMRMSSLLGHKSENMIGRCLFEFLPRREQQEKLRQLLSCQSPVASCRSCVVNFSLVNGELKRIVATVSAKQQPGTTTTMHDLIFSDVLDIGDEREITSYGCNGSAALHESSCSFSQSPHTSAEHEFNELLESANAIMFEVDVSGKVVRWNAQASLHSGFSAEEAMDRPFISTFVPQQYQADVHDMLQRAFCGRGVSNFELEIKMKDGRSRFLLISTTPRKDPHDGSRIVGVVAFAQDITESCKQERAVAAMASELRLLIDTANAPIFGIDSDGDVNEWNEKTAEITGYTKEEAFDCSLVDTFIVPSMRESVQLVLDNALEGRGTSNFDLEFRTKSNEIRHLLVNATTRRDAENKVVGVVGVAQDVTEAVQRDRAVAGMALELRQLIDTANAPIFGIDIDGNVNEWNRRTSEITGFSKEEAFDEPLVETFIEESMRGRVRDILNSALAGNDTSNYEVEFISKSGEPIFLLVNATTRRDPENAVVGVVGVAQDVTEDRKHAQVLQEMQYIRASQEAKVETERNMTAYFAHELRNPLGAIDSALNAMPDGLPESARTLISGMQLCSGFMSSIMNNLLDVRKMEEGKMTLNKSPISLNKVLYGVFKMLLPSVRHGVRFEKRCDTKGRDWVLGDAHRIQQVMTNVITNAIKYTLTGSITLTIGWEGDKVKFECIDTGPGIPKNEQEKLFQRFVQRGGAPGTGLGLAIAKHLVDLTGGTIRFESDPTIRAGTTCVVLMSLPECEAPGAIGEVSTALIEEPMSFLVIDDIRMNRMMLNRRILKGIAPKATITEAATGEEALELCETKRFDVIIVDQYMEEAGGVMVGTDVVFALRRMKIDSIVVGCSGNDMGEQFFEAGANWVWQKPMPSNAEIIQDLRKSMKVRTGKRSQPPTK